MEPECDAVGCVLRKGHDGQHSSYGPLDVALVDAMDGLKVAINELLWTRLPGSCSIGRADQLANKIHSMIEEEWEAWNRET